MSIAPERKIEIELVEARHLLRAIEGTVGDDEIAVHDAVEGETNLFEAFDKTLARMGELTALRSGIEDHIATLKERLVRLERGEDRLRDAIKTAMNALRLSRVERPLATLSIRPGLPSVVIDDLEAVPVSLKRWKGWEADKTAIKAALKNGPVAGASLLRGEPVLNVSPR